jgi:8-oxo-dGDP phosphatase
MAEPKPWRTLSSRTIVDDRWLKLRADECETAEGRRVSPYYVIEVPDFVHVAALTAARELVMVRQYRQATGRIHLELPAGQIDAEDPDAIGAARRELAEETGYGAKGWRSVATWHSSPPRLTSLHHLVLAEDAHRVGEQQLDGAESLTVELRPLAAAKAAALSGEIDSTQQVAAILRIAAELEGR